MKKIKSLFKSLVVIGICILLGFIVFYFVQKEVDKSFQNEIAWASDVSIATISTDHVQKLTELLPGDITGVEDFTLVNNAVLSVGKLFEIKGIDAVYVLAQKEGQVYFISESTPVGEPLYIAPGTIYEQAPPEVFVAFNNKVSPIANYTDEFGSYISKFTPIIDHATGQQIAVLGVDIDYVHYQAQLLKTKIIFIIAWIVFCAVIILLFAYLKNLYKIKNESQVNEQKITAIIDSISDGLVVVDNKGEIVFWNEASENIFGVSKEQSLGEKFNELVKLENIFDVKTNSLVSDFDFSPSGYFADNVLEVKIMSGKKKISKYYELLITITEINNEQHLVGIFHDISNRKEEQGALESQKDELEKLNNLMVGRELKMMEMKKELSKLKGEAE